MAILPPAVCRSYKGYYNMYNSTLNKCVKRYYSLSHPGKIGDHMMCAKNPKKGRATCQGDTIVIILAILAIMVIMARLEMATDMVVISVYAKIRKNADHP